MYILYSVIFSRKKEKKIVNSLHYSNKTNNQELFSSSMLRLQINVTRRFSIHSLFDLK